LRPVISLWFCDGEALPAPPPGRPEPFHARFEVREPGGGPAFSDHFALHIIELGRFRAALQAPSPAHRWLHFLAEAEGWQAVPALLHSKPLEAAMTLLHNIRADPKERALYEAYCKQLSIEQTIKDDMAELRAEAEGERVLRAQAEAERARAEQALAAERVRAEAALVAERAQAEAALVAERERAEALRAKLRALGLDPDALG
ncbi:MAG: PD-(D/E)XK nuclease family transposase, partial [Deltaproteobacteria bacterium]|nr:PD-(D/E)XK nuclease family transposase [Deltaproteobacteria bacterium]